MIDLAGKLYISTIADDAAGLALEYGLGLEITEFCTAYNMDVDFEKWDGIVRRKMRGIGRFTFHAPYNELCPAAIDPLVADVARTRYRQAYVLMRGYGINAMVAHAGFLPVLYHESWFVEKSAVFWKEFLSDKPADFRLYLENMLEPSPDMLCDIIGAVDDERFKLCLDIGHAANSGIDASIEKWIGRTLPYLGHVHLNNNHGDYDSHNALGDGNIDVRSAIRRIAGAAPDVTFTLESAAAGSSIDWLRANSFLRGRHEQKNVFRAQGTE